MVDAATATNNLASQGTINPSSISQGLSNTMHTLTLFFVILIAVVFLVAIVWLMYYMLSFNIHCVTEEKLRNGHILVRQMKAKIYYDKKLDGKNLIQRMKIFGVKKPFMFPVHYTEAGIDGVLVEKELEVPKDRKGVPKYTLINTNSLPEYLLFGITRKGKYALRLLKEGDEYTAIPWENEKVSEYLRVSKPVRQQWANNLYKEHLELLQPPKNFWDKYGGAIVMGSGFLVILIVFVMFFNKLDVIQSYSAALNNYAEGMKQLAAAIRETGVQRVA